VFPLPADSAQRALILRLSALSADSMEGRRAGSVGSRRARAWIERELAAVGAVPVGATYAHEVKLAPRGGGTDTIGANIIARIPGRTPGGKTIVLSAHYDHLGVRNGQIYNGADDDASGCVALLAIAERLRTAPLEHDVLLAFFDGEEMGMPGSRAFIAAPPIPLERVAFDLSLDMVARQDGKALWVSGTSHYPELKPLAERAIAPNGIPIRFGHDTKSLKPDDDWTNSSDHAVFHAKHIPFLYLGVEDHPDYHKPGDHADRVDPAFYLGAVDYAYRVLREVDAWSGLAKSRAVP
jgi:Zn-dependent M28 family amino/carboxypeptidase